MTRLCPVAIVPLAVPAASVMFSFSSSPPQAWTQTRSKAVQRRRRPWLRHGGPGGAGDRGGVVGRRLGWQLSRRPGLALVHAMDRLAIRRTLGAPLTVYANALTLNDRSTELVRIDRSFRTSQSPGLALSGAGTRPRRPPGNHQHRGPIRAERRGAPIATSFSRTAHAETPTSLEDDAGRRFAL